MLQELKIVLECLPQPAFVRDGQGILLANPAAQALGLQVGAHPILERLPRELEAGQCALELSGQRFDASLRPVENAQLVICTPVHEPAEQALASAARALRQPLQKLMLETSRLWPYLEEQEDETIQAGTASISHGLYQMLRAVNNLADLGLPEDSCLYQRKRTFCNDFLAQFMERAEPLVESTGRHLVLDCSERHFYALMDVVSVERALLNLLSNAIAHTPAGQTITLRAWREDKLCCIALTNPGQPVEPAQLDAIFGRYARQDLSLLSGGAGFGMQIAGNVARNHGGSLLVRPEPVGGLTVVLSMEAAELRFGEAPIRTPQMQLERTGGFDHFRMELSEVLDDACFDSRNM